MTPDTMIVVRTPADLVAATPYVIGFHPTDSLVVLGITGGRIFFGARHDLPPPDGDDIVHLGAIVAAQRARSIALLAYGPPAVADPVVRRALEVFAAFRVRVTEAIRVHGGRWWSYLCSEPECCPADGSPFDAATSVIAAEATYRGQVVLPDRQALVAQVAPVDGPARAAMVAATARARDAMHRLITDDQHSARAVRQAGRLAVREAEKRYRAGQCLSDDEVAWLGVLLIDPDVHEYALERRGGQQWRLALWTDVLRRVEAPYVAAVGCLLGYLAWQAGEGALARVAVDRARRADPRHRMAGLLDDVLGMGIGPHALRSVESSALATVRPPGGPVRHPAARGKGSPLTGAGPDGSASGPEPASSDSMGAAGPRPSGSASAPSGSTGLSPSPGAPAPSGSTGLSPSSGAPALSDPAAPASSAPVCSSADAGGPARDRSPRRERRFRRALRRRSR